MVFVWLACCLCFLPLIYRQINETPNKKGGDATATVCILSLAGPRSQFVHMKKRGRPLSSHDPLNLITGAVGLAQVNDVHPVETNVFVFEEASRPLELLREKAHHRSRLVLPNLFCSRRVAHEEELRKLRVVDSSL